MRVAIMGTCPPNVYSGGRYHALIAAYCLARRGHEVYFISDNTPIFDEDLRCISPDNPVNLVLSRDFDTMSEHRMDMVIVTPQVTKYRRLYTMAARLAERSNAGLGFFCFEAGNWFNTYSPKKRPLSGWNEWHYLANRGCLILCSANESKTYAESFFTKRSPESTFDVWQPAINSVARDLAVVKKREKKILLFARPSDSHKGSDIVDDLMVPELKDYTFSIIIGNPRGAEAYKARLNDLAHKRGMKVEFLASLSDIEKFHAIKSASALVFPSKFEGYGYPPLEALACDTPCVAYELPVVRETCGNLVHFAPVGNVDALRANLIKAVSMPAKGKAAKPSKDPNIHFLTDIDERAQAIESVITTYLEGRIRFNNNTAVNLSRAPLRMSNAQNLSFGDRHIIQLTLASKARIISAIASSDWVASCNIVDGFVHDKQIYHYITLVGKIGAKPTTDIKKTTLYLTFFEGSIATLDINLDLKAPKAIPTADTATAGITELKKQGNSLSLFCWALPKEEYDTALWLSKTETTTYVVKGDTNLVTADYRIKSGIKEKVDCGISFFFDSSDMIGKENALILMRAGVVVYARGIESPLSSSVRTSEGTYIATTPQAYQGHLHASATLRTQNGIYFKGYTSVTDEKILFEVRRKSQTEGAIEQILTRLPINFRRADVQKTKGLPHSLYGITLLLPDIKDERQEYSIAMIVNGTLKSRIALDKFTLSDELPTVLTSTLSPLAEKDLYDKPWNTVIKRPLKNAISRYIYDIKTGKLHIDGWALIENQLKVSLHEADTDLEIASTKERTARKDVAENTAKLKFVDYGYEITKSIEKLTPAGYILRMDSGDGQPFDQNIGLPQPSAIKEFKVIDSLYDEDWSMLWIRGTFVQPGLKLAHIEAYQGKTRLAAGVVNIKQMREGEPNAGWRFETMLDAPIDISKPIEIRATTTVGVVCKLDLKPKTTVPQNESELGFGYIAKYGVEAAVKRFLAPTLREDMGCVLLLVHNLDAVDRPEKAIALASLRQQLHLQGLELVVMHHSRHPNPTAIPEINFFDPLLDQLAILDNENDPVFAESAFPQAARQRAIRALYGFSSTVNPTPKDKSVCAEQIAIEARRVLFCLKHIKPQFVLIWHQWNSLMEIARSISDHMQIPSAFLHEGMLPKTMTCDPKGMMAEASCVGARLTITDETKRTALLAKAEDIITTICEQRLDRKPLSGLSAGKAIADRAHAEGAKLVFYAGINDWHSGNLPREAGYNIHSPIYEDTLDGLRAVADLAEANNWLVMFKPHPNLYPSQVIKHPRVVIVRESNVLECLEAADVTVTILSSIAYIAMANKKPTVLMGRNTLSDSGAVYEVTERDALEATINDAIDQVGFSDRQEAFRDHVAALFHEHLYVYDPNDSYADISHGDLARYIKMMSEEEYALYLKRRP